MHVFLVYKLSVYMASHQLGQYSVFFFNLNVFTSYKV